jgi:predicted acylesterase/phospholipase RssA
MTSVTGDTRAEFLSAVPVFSGLSPGMRETVAERSSWVRFPAGAWIMRQDEPGDSLFVLRSGRLEILLEQPRTEVVRVLTRGAVVGELALLTGSPRSASVRARRDSELLRLDRDDFVPLLTEQPEFAVALAHELGHQLQLSRGLPVQADALPATVAVVGLGAQEHLGKFSDGLGAALGNQREVATMCPGRDDLAEADYASALDRSERDHDVVLLLADPERSPPAWSDFCLRQADRVLVLAGKGADRDRLVGNEHLRGCDLLSMGDEPRQTTARLIELLAPRIHRPVPAGAGMSAIVESIARRLAGRSIGIVLSGGGARGFAHIGVLDELQKAGVGLDRVAGCSMGAFVGAMFAAGMPAAEMVARCRREFVERSPLSDYTVPSVALVRGNRAEALLRRTFGTRQIEWLPREFFCVTCDLMSGELVVHRRGPLYEAVGASMCLPAILPPVAQDGRLLVDGGVLNNLPVEPMASSAEGPVIASDVTAQFTVTDATANSGRGAARAWLARRVAVRGAGTAPLPGLKETLIRSITIGSVDNVAAARERADVLIEPPTSGTGMLEFAAIDRMVAAGRRAALDALATESEILL